MLSKTRSAPYAGEIPEIEPATISLRTQLRLSYETYAWLRYLSLGGLALAGLLLILLPGGFPPPVFAALWQDLPLAGHLLALHGPAAFLALLALLVQALTWLVLWGLYLHVGRILILSTWRLHHTQAILASGWQSSASFYVEAKGQAVHNPSPAASLNASGGPSRHPAAPGNAAVRPQELSNAARRVGIPYASTHTPESQGYRPDLLPVHTQSVQRHPPAFTHTQPAQAQRPGNTPRTNAQFTPPVAARTASSPRQFVQPTMPLNRPRMAPVQGDPSTSSAHAPSTQSNSFTSAPRADWPALAVSSEPGIAWDVGLTRKDRPNEDSVLTLRGACNFADRLLPFELHIVADGMGGHAHGRLASHLAIKGMLETVIPGLMACKTLDSEQIVDVLIDGVHWANQVIYQYGREHEADMGTTITAVLLLDELAYVINVGDSRTYIYRPDAGLTQITRDHSLVARLVETGAITPDAIYTHPERNKVYRGLGDKTDVTVDWFILPVQVGDLLLLCSDGLWEMVRDPHITEILATFASAPVLASNALLRAALQAGGKDNVSLLVVRVA